jgi:deoxyribodipyrimidine photo-lyase
MVDASMRCLVGTGWLNFRMRAMCASFFSYILHQPWRLGADFFYYHLVDADPAINYTQWQQQAGVTGVNTMRIYNPRKQVRDNDPEGEFVHEWVPELRPVPADYLDRPERIPLHLQAEFGVDVGTDYPLPVVDYEARREAAADRFSALQARAHEALEDPEIRRRASLSQRGGRTRSGGGDDSDGDGPGADQASLSDFG